MNERSDPARIVEEKELAMCSNLVGSVRCIHEDQAFGMGYCRKGSKTYPFRCHAFREHHDHS